MSTNQMVPEEELTFGPKLGLWIGLLKHSKAIDSHLDSWLFQSYGVIQCIDRYVETYGKNIAVTVENKDGSKTTTLEPVFERYWKEMAKHYAECAIRTYVFTITKNELYPHDKKWEQKSYKAADEAAQTYKKAIATL